MPYRNLHRQFLVFCVIVIAIVAVSAAAYAGWFLPDRRLTTDTADQQYPDVSGTKVVYQDNRNGNWDIYLYDLATNTEKRLTTNTADQKWPAISGTRVVWYDERNDGGIGDIYLYDLATNTEKRLTTNEHYQGWPDISGTKVVYEDNRSGTGDVYLYDLATNTEKRLTNGYAGEPAISGNRVVYTRDPLTNSGDIYLYDILYNTTTHLTNDGSQGSPDISGTKVVYSGLRNNILNQPVLQICLYDLATNTERRLTDEVGSPRGDADIEGNYAVWHDYRNGNMDIYLYDLATNTERQLTTDVAYQGVPAISGTNVVYQDARNEPGTYGNDDIYLTAFAVPKIVVSMPSILSYNGRATVTGTFKDANGGPLAGKPVRIQYSSNGVSWSSMPLATTTASGAFVAYTPYLTSARYVRVAFAGDADFPPAVSAATLIKPKVYLTNPAAPSHARLNTGFSVYGYLKPHHTSGTYPVRIYKYRYSSGTWRSYGYTSAKASNYSSFTKYSRLISLPKTGRWRLRTYTPADSGHAATWSSGYDYVVVR